MLLSKIPLMQVRDLAAILETPPETYFLWMQ